MIILALDYGIKKIGAAISETKLLYAQPIKSFSAKKHVYYENIDNIMKLWKPKKIIVGYPLNGKGKKQNITKKTELFIKNLKNRYILNIILHDERLTTIEAKNLFFKKKNNTFKKKCIHSIAAKIILESWLNSKNSKNFLF